MYTRIGDPIPILDPFCTAIVYVEMEKQEQPPPPHTDMFLVMMICKENKIDLQGLISSNEATTQASLLRHVEELGGEVHAATLTTAVELLSPARDIAAAMVSSFNPPVGTYSSGEELPCIDDITISGEWYGDKYFFWLSHQEKCRAVVKGIHKIDVHPTQPW